MASERNHRVLCVGAGNTGRSHILAYHRLDGLRVSVRVALRHESR